MEAAPHPWPALGVLLMRDGLVSKEELEDILRQQHDARQQRLSGRRLGEILIRQGRVTPTQVARLVAEQYELPFIDFDIADVDLHAAGVMKEDDARRFSALPISVRADGTYLLAIADPGTVLFSEELRKILGSVPRFAVVGPDAIERAIDFVFGQPQELRSPYEPEPEDAIILDFPPGGPVIAVVEEPELEVPQSQTAPLLGALLVRDGYLTEADLDAALAQQRLSPTNRLGEILVERGMITPSVIARLVAEQYELRYFDLGALEVDRATAARLPEEIARRVVAVPIAEHEDGSLDVAISDPTGAAFWDELHQALGVPLTVVMASPDAIEALLDRVHERTPDTEAEMAEATEIEPMADPYPAFLVDAVDQHAPEVVDEMPSVAFVMDAFAKPWDEEPAFPESKDEPERAEEAVFEQEPPHLLFDASTSSVLDEPADDEASWTSRLELVDELLGDEEPEALEAEIFGLAAPEEPESKNPAVFELALPPTAEIVQADVEPAVEEHSEPPVAEVTETDVFELAVPEEPELTEHAVFELSWPAEVELGETPDEPSLAEDLHSQIAEATDAELFSVAPPEGRELADAPEAPNLDVFGIGSQPPVAAEEPAFEEEPEPQVAAAEEPAEEDLGPAFEAASPVHFSVHTEHVSEEPPAFHVEHLEHDVESDAFAEAEVETRIEPEQELAVEPEAEPEQRSDFDTVVEHVLAAGASTLHFSPHGNELAVRARVDGFVRDLGTASHDERDALIARLEAQGVARTHVVTTSRGEKTTLFVRERSSTPASLEELGLDSGAATLLRSALGRPSGAIVVCGPTGSGTTTTLYTALEALATPDRIVTTVEQPVHRLLEGVDQIEVDAANGVTFASALHELRFVDTDAVLVGEIGDRQAADLALGAAYEGRFVLAGFRAPSAAAAILRLADMGVEPATLAASLGCVVSQRLVRTVCTDCRETYYASEEELSALDQPESGSPRLLVRGAGCSSCDGSGFRGRTGLFEVMPVTDEIRELVAGGASAKKIQKAAVAAGMRTLREEGVRLCLDGVTAAAEVARVLREDS